MSTRKIMHWAPHYHRCRRCGGFFACEEENSKACEKYIEYVVSNDCGLGINQLQFEARHSSIKNDIYEQAAMHADLA